MLLEFQVKYFLFPGNNFLVTADDNQRIAYSPKCYKQIISNSFLLDVPFDVPLNIRQSLVKNKLFFMS